MTSYAANREVELSFTPHPEEFKRDFSGKLERTVPLNILIDNLKRYVHLFDDSPDDIRLLLRALRLFHTQRSQNQQKTDISVKKDYVFGPVVMRAFSYFNQPTIALKVRFWNFSFQIKCLTSIRLF